MKSQLRERAIDLRLNRNLSYSRIKKAVPVSKSTLSYWLRNFPLSIKRINELKRAGWSKAQSKIEKFRTAMRRKRDREDQKVYEKYQRRFKKLTEETFFIAGLMLYLGEGSKTDYHTVKLSNTDPDIMQFFIRWLNEFLETPRERIKAALHLYENMDIEKEKSFWKHKLRLKERQFYKPWITKLRRSSFSYKESFRHGTCSVMIGGVKEKREVMMAIRAFVDKFKVEELGA